MPNTCYRIVYNSEPFEDPLYRVQYRYIKGFKSLFGWFNIWESGWGCSWIKEYPTMEKALAAMEEHKKGRVTKVVFTDCV